MQICHQKDIFCQTCSPSNQIQRCRKDFLIGGGTVCICSTGHIEWAWNRQKTWGSTCPRYHPPPVPMPMKFILFLIFYSFPPCKFFNILNLLSTFPKWLLNSPLTPKWATYICTFVFCYDLSIQRKDH